MDKISENRYNETQAKWGHLFEIAQPNPEMIEKNLDWSIKDGYDVAGTLLVGDLWVIKNDTNVLETHPFPEWVIQIYQLGRKSGKVYAILPKITESQLNELNLTDYTIRVKNTQKILEGLQEEDFFAIEYHIGMDIKIPANVPHEFISVVSLEEYVPYCQVFEPNMEKIMNSLRMEPAFYKLQFRLKMY